MIIGGVSNSGYAPGRLPSGRSHPAVTVRRAPGGAVIALVRGNDVLPADHPAARRLAAGDRLILVSSYQRPAGRLVSLAMFQTKLDGIGFGFLVPVFFITTGVQFDARALLGHPAAIAEIPLFLAALLLVRGTPALLYARRFGQRRAEVAGLMQATSLTFVIVAAQIGTATGQISQSTAAALLAAGLLSAALFPAAALKLLTAGAEARLSRSGVLTTPPAERQVPGRYGVDAAPMS